jgi:hypothetical protein
MIINTGPEVVGLANYSQSLWKKGICIHTSGLRVGCRVSELILTGHPLSLSSSMISKDQFEKKKNDMLDPEPWVLVYLTVSNCLRLMGF